MTYLARNIDTELLKWKESPRRKPLLVRNSYTARTGKLSAEL